MEIDNWLRIGLAGEQVLSWTEGRVTMAFGLGPPTVGDPPQARCRRLLDSIHPPLRALRWAQQVHGREVKIITEEGDAQLGGVSCVGPGDALMTAEPGVAVLVWTADCVPVLFEGSGVVAAVHSGWRGTAQDIVGKVVRLFESEYGVPPRHLRAVLGPAISGPRYEVGWEVVKALDKVDVKSDEWRKDRHVDLRKLISERLCRLGLSGDRVSRVGPCTVSTPYLASYRRDGSAAGRQFAFVYRSDGSADRRPRS